MKPQARPAWKGRARWQALAAQLWDWTLLGLLGLCYGLAVRTLLVWMEGGGWR
jgi:hypothetical protein